MVIETGRLGLASYPGPRHMVRLMLSLTSALALFGSLEPMTLRRRAACTGRMMSRVNVYVRFILTDPNC